ncbi:MAG: zinc-finger domain-containing protein [Wolbachia sp.]
MSEVRVNKKKVCCHGDEDDEGSAHPLIYLDMGDEEKIDCPYCDKAFIYDCTVEIIKEK